ncbi:MAG: UbiA family prenyltransferase [Flavobacteriales bacterium]|nr:UbiA family prenyltransferase [Flavobacteriales bacterium]
MAFWLREVMALFKLRLASLVVVSAVLGYLLGIAPGAFSGIDLLMLVLGGTLLTGASNALNQVFEVQEDGLMHRTAERPLVRRTLGMAEAIGALSWREALVSSCCGWPSARSRASWASSPYSCTPRFTRRSRSARLGRYSLALSQAPSRRCWGTWRLRVISVLALACSSPCNSCGNSRTSGPLRGCSMRIMHAAASACSPRPAAPMAAAPS